VAPARDRVPARSIEVVCPRAAECSAPVNRNRVDTMHRLATGNRLRSYYYDFEVIAII
jgi:hypothetical protein